jgi:hypothetical protein
MNTIEFFGALYGHFDSGYLNLFTTDRNGHKATEWFSVDRLDQMAARAEALTDRNVWFSVATRRRPLNAGGRGGAADCLAIPALWADIDIAGSNHKHSDDLPQSVAAAMELVGAFPLRPSIVVHTGGGLHPYWVLSEPCPVEAAIALLERWATTWDRLAAKLSLRADNVYDLARVLRVPGTRNIKNDPSQPVFVIEANGLLYGVDDIIENTDEPPPRAHRSAERGPVIGIRPGDEYNQRHTGGDVLSAAGWTLNKIDRSGDEHWLHPWGATSEASATVYADGHTAIWSDTAVAKSALEKRHSYDPFGLYTALFHDGDHPAASRRLASEGYGSSNVTIIERDDGSIGRGKRHINTANRSLDDLTNDIVAELGALNDPPFLFAHGEIVTQFDRGQLDPIDRVRLTHVVETLMSPVKYTKNGEAIPTRIDTQTLELALYRLQRALPPIEGVMHAPFLRADGTVCADVGYDATSRLYLSSTLPVNVPIEPTSDDVEAAVATVDEMLYDFPLESDADRAHVFALLLTLITRHLVPLVPLFAFDGNGPGVGKNLLSECCVYVVAGEWVQTDPLPLDPEEQRKQITALLSTGSTAALFDEAHTLTGTSLARLITSTTWADRLLGYSKRVSYPNRLTAIALGNNIEVQGDMPRRTLLIRLASDLAHPELRQDFRHGDLRGWITNHRAGILEALLVMLRSWSAAGSKPGSRRLGSFDAWAQLIGGVLEHVGIEGFLGNADEMRSRGATDDVDMAAHLAELHEHFGTFAFTTGEVAALLLSGRVETWPPKVGTDDRKLAKQLGHVYRRAIDRWFDDVQLTVDGMAHGNVRRWTLAVRSAKPQESGGKGGNGGSGTSFCKFFEGNKSVEAEVGGPLPPFPPSPPSEAALGPQKSSPPSPPRKTWAELMRGEP